MMPCRTDLSMHPFATSPNGQVDSTVCSFGGAAASDVLVAIRKSVLCAVGDFWGRVFPVPLSDCHYHYCSLSWFWLSDSELVFFLASFGSAKL